MCINGHHVFYSTQELKAYAKQKHGDKYTLIVKKWGAIVKDCTRTGFHRRVQYGLQKDGCECGYQEYVYMSQ